MIGTQITIKNHDTSKQIIINDHSQGRVIALQEFPKFEADVRPQNIPKQGTHGEFRLPYYYSGMTIVLNGVIAGEDEEDVWELKRDLDEVMALSRKGVLNKYTGNDDFPPMDDNTVRLSFTDPTGRDVFIDATPIKSVSYNRPLKQTFKLDFQVILRASFPFLLVEDEIKVIELGELGGIDYGFKLESKLPISLGTEYLYGEVTVEMETAGLAVVTLKGSDTGVIINPKVTNITNGNYMKIRKPLVGANRYFKINSVYQTVIDENGKDVSAFIDGDFIHLEEGENKLIYSADNVIPQ